MNTTVCCVFGQMSFRTLIPSGYVSIDRKYYLVGAFEN